MNWFRHLIKDYGKIAQPLMDLTRNAKKEAEADERAREAKHGKKPRKGNFKRFLRETHLGPKWTQECEDAFFKLKVLITSEPVLRSIRRETVPGDHRWMCEGIWRHVGTGVCGDDGRRFSSEELASNCVLLEMNIEE